MKTDDEWYQLGRRLAQILYDEMSELDYDDWPHSHKQRSLVYEGIISKFEKWKDDEDERVSGGWDDV